MMYFASSALFLRFGIFVALYGVSNPVQVVCYFLIFYTVSSGGINDAFI